MPDNGMTRVAPRPAGGKAGTSLIELLIAISISLVVMAVALSVYGTVNLSRQRQETRRERNVAAALQAIRRDLAGVIQTSYTNAPPLDLELSAAAADGQEPSSTLLLCVGQLAPEASIERLAATQVRYRLRRSPDAPSGDLLRESVSLTGPDASPYDATNALLQGMSGFSVSVLAGDTWTNQWRHRPGRRPPRAADIRISWISGTATQTVSVLTPIPSGETFPANRPTGASSPFRQ